MVLPLVALLLQAPQLPAVASPADGKIVRVWLDSDSPLRRGAAVRVYIEANQDGNLVVLHRRTDGRIDVLFPSKPTDDPFVQLGTYEIRGSGDRPGLVVAEPDGTGMILAALSPDPLRFNEFVRFADWNPDALAPAWSGSDAEGSLSDIVQRMLGDGALSYDIVTYTVAPPIYAEQDTTPPDTATNYALFPPCPGCTYIGQQFIIYGSDYFCDAFWDACLGGRRFAHEPRCDAAAPCGARPLSALAYTGPRLGIGVAPLVAQRVAARPAPARNPAVPPGAPSIPTRPRSGAAPSAGAGFVRGRVTSLVPGRRSGHAKSGAAVALYAGGAAHARATGFDTPISHVRFTLTSTPASEEPQTVRVGPRRDEPVAGAQAHVIDRLEEGGVGRAGGGAWGGGAGGSGAASTHAGARQPRSSATRSAPPVARPNSALGLRAAAPHLHMAPEQVVMRQGPEWRSAAARARGGGR